VTIAPRYDVAIIGAGQAGLPLANGLALRGKRVALIERKHLGGSCINFGCTPTKAAIASARLAHLARRGREFGLHIPEVTVDFAAVIERARNVAAASRNNLEQWLGSVENPTLLRGQGRLAGRAADGFHIRVGETELTAGDVVLNTGTRSVFPPIDGLADIAVIHAGNWLEHKELPRHLAIIGSGAIGLEMGQFYRRMGAAVTVLEAADRIAGHEDADIASAMQRLLEEDGIRFHLKSAIARVRKTADGVVVEFGGGAAPLAASHLFVATGRKPNTDDLGLESVGLEVPRNGIVAVDARLATAVPGLWVGGDIRGGPQFTHTSWDDHRVLLSQLAGDGKRTTKRIVPYAIFTDPELGRVGLTETQARQAGRAIKVARFAMAQNGKAAEIGETQGEIKLVVDAASGEILGAAILAAEAAELVHIYIDAMNAGAPYHEIANAVFIHPTLAEAVQSATLELD
jgi:pyruvate/2-oxoglutarate dehydrogenase complex dihydrolipoamide dehydrogenase (E3) component